MVSLVDLFIEGIAGFKYVADFVRAHDERVNHLDA